MSQQQQTFNKAIELIDTANSEDPNQENVDVFFFTTGSPDNRQTHLKILAELSRLCLKTDFLKRARECAATAEIIETFQECLDQSHQE